MIHSDFRLSLSNVLTFKSHMNSGRIFHHGHLRNNIDASSRAL